MKRPKPPSASDISNALAKFRTAGELCYVRPWTANQGIGAEISFNTATYSSSAGQLTVALRRAVLEITATGDDWSWNQDVVDAAESRTVREEQTTTNAHTTTGAIESELEGTARAKVKSNIALLEGEAEAVAKARAKASHSNQRLVSEGSKSDRIHSHLRIQHKPPAFIMEFNAHTRLDLVELNPGLHRLPLLDVPTPAALDLNQVKMDLSLALDPSEPTQHAFSIKIATGPWAQLKASRNKAIIAELLLSKFLVPVHAPLRVWPPQTTAGSAP